ncbi:MAG: hypothetical protein JNM39_18590 [Bdellovibrionaceae bacterium]|nr:hypothetical protein [Pseudobdellovibrionaceae bacterium]
MSYPKTLGLAIFNIAILSATSFGQVEMAVNGADAGVAQLVADLQNRPRSQLTKVELRSQNTRSIAGGGVIGTGGGNGVQTSDGKITPLDVVFSQETKVIDVKKEYSVGYKFFQEQVDKIAKAIPSFADDINIKFSRLTWIGSGLELSSKKCLNNMGIFQVRLGDKQVVLACQYAEGEVSLNVRAIKQLKNPKYLGVVFLHEAFVYSMLREYRADEYPNAEFQMISKVVPYIVSNKTLNPEKLYEYAQIVRYVREYVDSVSYKVGNKYNNYALEVYIDRRAEINNDHDSLQLLEARQSHLKSMVESFNVIRENVKPCEGDGLANYIVAYNRLKNEYQSLIDFANGLSKTLHSVGDQAMAVGLASDTGAQLVLLVSEHNYRMTAILQSGSCKK